MADEQTQLPSSDEEFVFQSASARPPWVDKGGAGADEHGPVINLPRYLDRGDGPYTTIQARKGDTIKFHAKTASEGAYFEVVPKKAEEGAAEPMAKPTPTTTKSSAKS